MLGRSIALNVARATAKFGTQGLAEGGVYTLRPRAGSQALARRVTCYLTSEYQNFTRQ